MDEKIQKLRAHIARLNLLARALEDRTFSGVEISYRDDFQDIIRRLGALLGEDISFLSNHLEGFTEVDTKMLALRVKQAIAFFNECYAKELGLEQVNITLDGLRDRVLKDRCGDLLRATDHYDRAVNQATLILEDRLRQKSTQGKNLTGPQLVNTLIKVERDKSPLILSSDDNEQRGFADIIRGIMAAHRNPTHHTIYAISQLDAARICAYIDVVLEIVDRAQPNPSVQKNDPK